MEIIGETSSCDLTQPYKTFSKKPSSFQEQIAKLKTRGMVIEDEAALFFILQHINYYRLEAYWFTYYVPGENEHRFLPNTNFNHIWKDYSFDRKFRALILQGLERIEISFKTQFTYYVAHKYGNFPFFLIISLSMKKTGIVTMLIWKNFAVNQESSLLFILEKLMD